MKRDIRIGDTIYCHTDGFMLDDGEQFSTVGMEYEVIEVSFGFDGKPRVMIIDDKGRDHTFYADDINNNCCEWFCRKGEVLKPMTLIKQHKMG